MGPTEKDDTTSKLITDVVGILPGHMNNWNGPWGKFVRHVWGGVGREKRETIPQDAALVYQYDLDLLDEVRENHTVSDALMIKVC